MRGESAFLFSLLSIPSIITVMHIGLIIYGSLETVSGGYLYDRKLVAYLREQGHTVEVVSLPWRNYPRHLRDNFSEELLSRLQTAKFDILLQDELNHPSLFRLNGRLRATVSYPIISIVHHLRVSEQHPSWQMPLYESVEQTYLQSVDGFIFNSETTRAAVENWVGKERPYVVAPPAGNLSTPDIDEAELEKRAKDDDLFRILFVGNIIPRKGLHTLIAAVRQLHIGTYGMDIVGDTAVDPKYAHNCLVTLPVNGNITVHGKVSDEQLAALYARNQVLAVPSQYEGYGIVYLEGMQFGCPAIGSTAGAAHEIIEDGRNGFLVPPEDADTLARKLLTLQNDRHLLFQMSRNAWQSSHTHPTWKQSMAMVMSFLESLV